MIVVLKGVLKVKIVSDSLWQFRAEEEAIWSIHIPLIHHLRRRDTIECGVNFDRIKDSRIEFEILIRSGISGIERSNPIIVGPPTTSYSGAHLELPNIRSIDFR